MVARLCSIAEGTSSPAPHIRRELLITASIEPYRKRRLIQGAAHGVEMPLVPFPMLTRRDRRLLHQIAIPLCPRGRVVRGNPMTVPATSSQDGSPMSSSGCLALDSTAVACVAVAHSAPIKCTGVRAPPPARLEDRCRRLAEAPASTSEDRHRAGFSAYLDMTSESFAGSRRSHRREPASRSGANFMALANKFGWMGDTGNNTKAVC